jgi:hypothetical protein
MHERMRSRIAALQEFYSWQRPADEVICHIHFAHADRPFEPTIAECPNGFVCHRRSGERVEDFEARADIEQKSISYLRYELSGQPSAN